MDLFGWAVVAAVIAVIAGAPPITGMASGVVKAAKPLAASSACKRNVWSKRI